MKRNIGFIGIDKFTPSVINAISKENNVSFYSQENSFDNENSVNVKKCDSPEDVAKQNEILFVKKNFGLKAIKRLADIIKIKNSIVLINSDDISFKELDEAAGFEIKCVKYEIVGELCAVCIKNGDKDIENTVNEIFNSYEIIKFDEKHFPLFYSLCGITDDMTQRFVKSLSDAGEKCGLNAEDAKSISAQTVLGSAKLIKESGEHPVELIDRVCSPGGTTIEGLLSLKKEGFEGLITQTAERILGE